MDQIKACIIIPARLNSARLPKKMLLNRTGMPLVQHTYESACQSALAQDVFIASDSYEIYQTVGERIGYHNLIQTSESHTCGTNRVIEAVKHLKYRGLDYDIVVNVQGDTPIISGECIDSLISTLVNSDANIATLVTRSGYADHYNPSCVKVVRNRYDEAMYFSRSPIPFQMHKCEMLKHIGVYAFKCKMLYEIAGHQAEISKAEELEQLSWLYNGHKIKVILVNGEIFGSIDTHLDYNKFVELYNDKPNDYDQRIVFVKDFKICSTPIISAGTTGITTPIQDTVDFQTDFTIKLDDGFTPNANWRCPITNLAVIDCIRRLS